MGQMFRQQRQELLRAREATSSEEEGAGAVPALVNARTGSEPLSLPSAIAVRANGAVVLDEGAAIGEFDYEALCVPAFVFVKGSNVACWSRAW